MNEEPPLPADRTFQVGEGAAALLGSCVGCSGAALRSPALRAGARGSRRFRRGGMRPPFSFYKKENAPRPVEEKKRDAAL